MEIDIVNADQTKCLGVVLKVKQSEANLFFSLSLNEWFFLNLCLGVFISVYDSKFKWMFSRSIDNDWEKESIASSSAVESSVYASTKS